MAISDYREIWEPLAHSAFSATLSQAAFMTLTICRTDPHYLTPNARQTLV